ncbi:N2227-like protein-domain-containing protein [Peziza echinospora]|nr:N2227-like protein-domain-containing protein [Peziza echinospora]
MQTLHSLTTYKSRSLATLDRKRKAFSAHHLPRQSKHLLAAAGVDYLQKIRDTEARILANAGLCERILGHALGYYGVARAELDAYVRYWKKKSPGGRLVAAGAGGDHTSLTQALKHYVRDFSSEGRAERDVSFRRALRTLEILYPSVEGRKGVRVLVPGCGVGGLLWRVARMGFVAEGVEWSYYMNVVGHYVGSAPPPPEAPHSTSSLEGRQDGDGDGDADADVGKNVLYPYLDWWSHHATTGNMLRGITFPYNHPSTRIFLHEGDFLNLANLDTSTTTTQGDSPPPHPQPLQYPTILTLFFIDTARDITSYITTIHALLAPGGVWINFGPLLYGTSPYLELSLDEVVKVAEEVGFVFERLRKGGDEEGGLGGVWYGDGDEEDGTTVDTLGDGRVVGRRAGYSVDWRGLGRNEYLAQGWVARKKGGSVGE